MHVTLSGKNTDNFKLINTMEQTEAMNYLQSHVECWNLYAEDKLSIMYDATKDHLPWQYFKTVREGVSEGWPQHGPSKKDSYISEGCDTSATCHT